MSLIDEVEEDYAMYGNVRVKAYYKIVESLKVYYDYILLEDNQVIGNYSTVSLAELLYYLNE